MMFIYYIIVRYACTTCYFTQPPDSIKVMHSQCISRRIYKANVSTYLLIYLQVTPTGRFLCNLMMPRHCLGSLLSTFVDAEGPLGLFSFPESLYPSPPIPLPESGNFLHYRESATHHLATDAYVTDKQLLQTLPPCQGNKQPLINSSISCITK
jgi:hypothetical protein